MIANPHGLLTILFTLQYSELAKRFQYQGKVKLYNEIDYNSLVAYAAKATNINESNIRMSMDAIFDALQYFVTEGHGVELEGLGTFSFGIKCKATFSETEAQSQLDGLRQKFINFLPALPIRKAMKAVKLVKEIDSRNNPETTQTIISNVGFYPTGDRSKPIVPINDPTQQYLIKSGAVIRVDGANLQLGITPSLIVGEDGTTATLRKIAYVGQKPNIEAYYYVYDVPSDLAIKQISIIDSNNVEKFHFDGYVNDGNSLVRTVDYGVNRLMTGWNVLAMNADEPHQLLIRGNNISEIPVLVNDEAIVPIRVSNEYLSYVVALGEDDTLSINNVTYQFLFTGPEAAVQTISANGVTVQNGGSSSIIFGTKYHFCLSGSNMTKLRTSEIVSPEGTVISNLVKSNEMAEFDAVFNAGGTLALGRFSITLTEKVRGIEFDVAVGSEVDFELRKSPDIYQKNLYVTNGEVDVTKFFVRPRGSREAIVHLSNSNSQIVYYPETKRLMVNLVRGLEGLAGQGIDGQLEMLYIPEPNTTEYNFFVRLVE